MDASPTREALEAAHCWEAEDLVPGRPGMTDFRRRLRYHNARWREAHGHPIGTQPIDPRPDDRAPRLVGSRIPLAYARETGVTFLTDGALAAAKARSAVVEPNQSLDHQRTWADLLWSATLAFNLFGDLAGDLGRADRAVRALFPDAPGTVREIWFSHSPGWLDPAYLGSLRDFDAAIVLDVGNGKRGIVGIDVKYHERSKAETPKPGNMHRYLAVANGSGAFAPGATDALARRSDLAVVWLEHLLLQSMLQHAGGSWTWGRYVVVHPAGNSDIVDACARYRRLLSDQSTFGTATVEDLLGADVLPKSTAARLRERYLPS